MRHLGLLAVYCLEVGKDGGLFEIPSPETGTTLRVIATTGAGWDHVSVSTPRRCPNWQELEKVKRLFFQDSETAMQLHVPPAEHINNHPYCLHLWRPRYVDIPRPPAYMVGSPGVEPEEARLQAIATGAANQWSQPDKVKL